MCGFYRGRWLLYKWGKNDVSLNRIGGNVRFKFQALGNWDCVYVRKHARKLMEKKRDGLDN